MSRIFFISSIVVSLLYTAISATFLVNQNYLITIDIESVAHRAQVAADAEDMFKYMTLLKTNMERHGMTKGHTALIFKSPSNDLSLLYMSVNQIVERLRQVKSLPKNETAYQVALDDLRGTIRELEAPTGDFIWVNYWYLYLLYLIWIWPFVHFIHFLLNY